MKVLVIGSGGREHALVWKLSQSDKIGQIFVAPGNAGTDQIATNVLLTNKKEILGWLKNNETDLVLVGPDNYLAEGIVDDIQKLNIPVFGPTKEASKIEWSKSYAKQFMEEEGIPTATSKTFEDFEEASSYVKKQNFPIVIKADGLAFGKGVVIAGNTIEADLTLKEMLQNQRHGLAGSRVVIEEFMVGKEISVHAFCDGESFSLFPISKDHKRAYDGDNGPNTGGMGTIAPVSGVTEKVLEQIENEIIKPTITGLRKRGNPFTGVLFPGIMLTENGPKVIEFNARFGDPETQSYMRLLETDLVDILISCIEKNLSKQAIIWSDEFASCVVAASGEYPGDYKKGFLIKGLPEAAKDESVVVFHAGTTNESGAVVTSGGRVLNITATGPSLKKSLDTTYDAIRKISFEGMWFRNDIGLGE